MIISNILVTLAATSHSLTRPTKDVLTRDVSQADSVVAAVACLKTKQVPASLPGDADFAGLEIPFNIRLNYTPAIIVIPSTNEEVAGVVCCAADNGLKVQARSGGHSYASFSTGGRDGSLIVDLSNFHDVTLLPADQSVFFGGGTRLGNLDLAMDKLGKPAISHGTCSGIGVRGHFTHGGYGHSKMILSRGENLRLLI